jgi:hypothetical protein
LLAAALSVSPLGVGGSIAQQVRHPAFVIVERVATTGDESIQEQYAKLAREVLPKYARARRALPMLATAHNRRPLRQRCASLRCLRIRR